MSEQLRRTIRTLIQLVAAGALTALVDQVALDVPPGYAPYVVIGFTLLVTFAQNWLEENRKIPSLLKGTSRASAADPGE